MRTVVNFQEPPTVAEILRALSFFPADALVEMCPEGISWTVSTVAARDNWVSLS